MVHIKTLEIQTISIMFLAQSQPSQCQKDPTLMFLLKVPLAFEGLTSEIYEEFVANPVSLKDSGIAAENIDIVLQPNDLYSSLSVKLTLK